MVLSPGTMTITTTGEDSMQEWLPRHQGFDPAIVLQKALQGLCYPQSAVVDAVNQITQQSFPSGTGLSPEEQLLHSEVLRLSISDELSVDSGIQLGDPEGELSKTDDSAWQGSSSSPNDCISDKMKSCQTPGRPSAWHILLIIVSILIGLYLSHATVMPHQGGMVVNDNDQHHATPDVVVVTTPSDHRRPEKGGGRPWRRFGRRRPVLDIDDAVRGGGD
jgi:hypothetical protein